VGEGGKSMYLEGRVSQHNINNVMVAVKISWLLSQFVLMAQVLHLLWFTRGWDI
jgi:hypothetical protein